MFARCRLITTFLLAAGFLLAGLANPAAGQVFSPESFTLDNGLQVVVVSNHRAPIVTQMLWYKVGAADEPLGKSGLAHFLEHLLFKGTEMAAPGEFSELIAKSGGRENAFTGQDFTAYFQTIAKAELEMIMTYEADRMRGLILTPEVIEPERAVVLEERMGRIGRNPAARLQEMTQASLYLHHPYRMPIIGWEHEIKALSQDDILDFYNVWYRPSNAVLILAGDLDLAEVKALAEKTYGKIETLPEPKRLRVEEPPQWAPRRVLLADTTIQQPSLSLHYLAPSYGQGQTVKAAALEVLVEILGGSTGRLVRSLVLDEGPAVSAGAFYDGMRRDHAGFVLWISPRDGISLVDAEAALRDEIDKLLEDGVSADEVQDAQERLLDAAIYARDDIGTAPRVIGRAMSIGLSLEEIEAWPRHIETVTPEAILSAAKEIFRLESSVASILEPLAPTNASSEQEP